MEIEEYTQFPPAAVETILNLCRAAFENFDEAYLCRLQCVTNPFLLLATRNGQAIGFKLGYRRGPDLFYSWLGAVHPAAQRIGLATTLMERQHERLAELGYAYVETRTRSSNNRMIILNLRHGFEISGIEVDKSGVLVVIQRKLLPRSAL